jgi:hypothetical protein
VGGTGYIKQSRPFGSSQSHNSPSPYFCVVGDPLRFALLRKKRACLSLLARHGSNGSNKRIRPADLDAARRLLSAGCTWIAPLSERERYWRRAGSKARPAVCACRPLGNAPRHVHRSHDVHEGLPRFFSKSTGSTFCPTKSKMGRPSPLPQRRATFEGRSPPSKKADMVNPRSFVLGYADWAVDIPVRQFQCFNCW